MTATTEQITGNYAIDPTHSRIGFSARHAMVTKVRGAFNEFSGSGHFDAANPANSSLELSLVTASIDTGNTDRDGHLQSADFFDVEKFPAITFRSTSVSQSGDNTYSVTGDLTIRDKSNPVTFELEYTGAAKDPFGNERIGFEGATTVNRKDWDLTWNSPLDTGGVLVSEKITLEFDISAVKNS